MDVSVRLPMCLIPRPNSMHFKPAMSEQAFVPICLKESGKCNSRMLQLPEKAYGEISSVPSGIWRTSVLSIAWQAIRFFPSLEYKIPSTDLRYLFCGVTLIVETRPKMCLYTRSYNVLPLISPVKFRNSSSVASICRRP